MSLVMANRPSALSTRFIGMLPTSCCGDVGIAMAMALPVTNGWRRAIDCGGRGAQSTSDAHAIAAQTRTDNPRPARIVMNAPTYSDPGEPGSACGGGPAE